MFATEKLIRMALEEDLGSGDVTTLSTVPPGTMARALIKAKQECVVAGIQVTGLVFRTLDPSLKIEARVADGDRLQVGAPLMSVTGNVSSILMAERVALNFVQRLCGVATLTARFVAAVAETEAEIVDTRKTTPGWRSLEKYAVQVGGGRNHRHGLFDGILIKDNHIKAAGTITDAINHAQRMAPHGLKIEVEAADLNEVKEAARSGADIILLDNMDDTLLRQAVSFVREHYPAIKLEASGGIVLANVAQVAACGVDFISVGALTHSAPAIDISLDLVS
ncbi:MAG: carboxylating nicotinate-nucleotide diphosphorylase [Deltaproteobacteria bacterium]|nr:carboxylating nicotinate-nucleotide diphosphorylase [Deltaproteobacteria bacterium]